MNKQILDALGDLVARCDGDDGVRADGSNIDTAWANAVLAKAKDRQQQPRGELRDR